MDLKNIDLKNINVADIKEKLAGVDKKTYIKFGIGRATYDASQEIRNKHISREEAIALVKKFDGEFPDRYFNDIMEYLEIDPNYFRNDLTNKFRSPHLWGKDENRKWSLRHNVGGTGLED